MKIRSLTFCPCIVFSSNDPIAQGSTWNAAADYANEVQWQRYVAGNLSTTQLISAGVFLGTNDFKISGLTAVEGSANDYVKQYSSHNYPQSKTTANLPNLMKHNSITGQISQFKGEIAAANAKGRRHVFGETNSGKSLPGLHLSPLSVHSFGQLISSDSNPGRRRYQSHLRRWSLAARLRDPEPDFGD